MTNEHEQALYKHGRNAYQMSFSMEDTPEERARVVAVTVGAQAQRLGISKEDFGKWLQSAYSGLWVKESSLNPGLDAKDVRKIAFSSFKKHAVAVKG